MQKLNLRIFALIFALCLFNSCTNTKVKSKNTPFQGYACQQPDKSFDDFLEQFSNNKNFQQSRYILPLVYRSGSYSLANDYGVTVELLNMEKIKSLNYSIFRSKSERIKENIEQQIELKTERYIELLHYLPNADADMVLYKFSEINGCWFLQEFHDISL